MGTADNSWPHHHSEVFNVITKMEDKAEQLRQRFEKRQQARLVELKKKKVNTTSSVHKNETPEAFNTSFMKEMTGIEELLTRLDDDQSTNIKSQITEKFDEITDKLQKLQKFITDSVIFLPSYDVQHAQVALQQLQTKVGEKREQLLPRKKFTFKPKVKNMSTEKPNNTAAVVEKFDAAKTDVETSNTTDSDKYSFGFHDQINSEIVVQPYESNQKDIKLSNLECCMIKIFGCPSALLVSNLKSCKILCGPISRPAFVSDCLNSEFSLACQQLRIHSTENTIFNIHVTGKAVIEDCKDIGFAPFNWEYPGLSKDFANAGLSLEINKWDQVDDFNWLKFDEHSPNWYIIAEDNRNIIKET